MSPATGNTPPITGNLPPMAGGTPPNTGNTPPLAGGTLSPYALANYARWAVPSPQALRDTPLAALDSALAAFQQPNHGKVDTFNKNKAKDALIHALRTYVQGYIARNSAVTDEDREKAAPAGTTPTAHPAPDLRPETEAEPSGRGAHRVRAMNPST